jgi:transcriptional regulator with XRE-family HTH domain
LLQFRRSLRPLFVQILLCGLTHYQNVPALPPHAEELTSRLAQPARPESRLPGEDGDVPASPNSEPTSFSLPCRNTVLRYGRCFSRACTNEPEAIGKASGLTPDAISQWERVRSRPTRHSLDKLARGFGVSPTELCTLMTCSRCSDNAHLFDRFSFVGPAREIGEHEPILIGELQAALHHVIRPC